MYRSLIKRCLTIIICFILAFSAMLPEGLQAYALEGEPVLINECRLTLNAEGFTKFTAEYSEAEASKQLTELMGVEADEYSINTVNSGLNYIKGADNSAVICSEDEMISDSKQYAMCFYVKAAEGHSFSSDRKVFLNGMQVKNPYAVVNVESDNALRIYIMAKSVISFADTEAFTSNMDDRTVVTGTEITLPECSSDIPEGKEFGGWKINGAIKAPGDRYTVVENVTVEGFWTDSAAIEKYVVTLDSNNGSGITKTFFDVRGCYVLPLCPEDFPAPSNMVFRGWSLTADGTVIDSDTIDVSKDTVLYAVWGSKNTCMVTFEANGGSGNMNTYQVTEQDEFTLPVCGFKAPKGKEFDCWLIEGKYRNPGSTWCVTGDTTIVPVWKDKSFYLVSFAAEGGSGSMESVKITEDDEFILPECEFIAPAGKIFDCWMINDTCINPGIEYEVTEDITVYAVWKSVVGMWMEDIPDQVYTGKRITPVIRVYDGETLLTEKKDYTVVFQNNVNAANVDAVIGTRSVAPTVIITGRGNYVGRLEKKFNIECADISTAEVKDIIVAENRGRSIAISPVVNYNGSVLRKNINYDIRDELGNVVSSYSEEGEYVLYAVGKGNYTGSVEFTFNITKLELVSRLAIKAIPVQKYTGEAITPELNISYKGKKIEMDCFEEPVFANNINAGTATVTVTGKPEKGYSGSKTISFKIVGTAVTRAVTEPIPEHIYDGKKYEPELNITLDGKQLTLNKDYTVSYVNSDKTGVAKAVIKGCGGYSGTKTFTYRIKPFNVANDEAGLITVNDNKPIAVIYEKGGTKPTPVVKFGDEVLTLNKDYRLAYVNYLNVADAEADRAPVIRITFIGKFTGSRLVKHSIVQKNIAVCSTTAADKAYSSRTGAWKQTAIKVFDSNGKALVAGVDYNKAIKYYREPECLHEFTDEDAGADVYVYYVVVSTNKNYYGEIRGHYRITKALINSAGVSGVASQIYTGRAIVITEGDMTVKCGKDTLVAGEDYEIVEGSFKNNINKGKATCVIRGKGNYGGSRTVTFSIVSKALKWWYDLLGLG